MKKADSKIFACWLRFSPSLGATAGNLHFKLILNLDVFSDGVGILFFKQVFYLIFDNFGIVNVSIDSF